MGLFNLVENFFFISLGITFVLIMLLVFHFKQRLTALESKNEDIMSGLRNILGILSSHTKTLAKASYEPPPPYQQDMAPRFDSIPQTHISNPISTNAGITMTISPKIVVSDDEASESSDENEEYIDTENMLDAGESDLESSDTEDENILLSKSDIDNALSVSELVVDDILDDLIFDNINTNTNETIINDGNTNDGNTNDGNTNDDNTNDNLKEVIEMISEIKDDVLKNESVVSEIIVNNVEDNSTKKSEDVLVETNQLQEEIKDYKKMNINQLKALVITKGLFVDTSKMKKAEIVSLLSSL